MQTPRDYALRSMDVLAGLRRRPAIRAVDRVQRVRASVAIAVQAGIAAGVAWYAAHGLVGHATPYFAPIAAVVVILGAVGRRLRTAIELVLGVALGIGVGDVLIYFIGTGGWEIIVVVVLAILTSVFVGGSATLIGQASSSAVLVATLAPPTGGIYYVRFIDALVGGLIGVGVLALLLPVNPLTTVRHAVGPALDILAAELTGCADALAERDVDQVRESLERIRSGDAALIKFRDSLEVATETVSISPTRWHSRAPLAQYLDSAEHIDRALRNAPILIRRSITLLEDDEPVSPELLSSMDTLVRSIRTLHHELAGGVDPEVSRQLALEAVARSADAYQEGLGFSGEVVIAQIRTMATDLLRATGMDEPTSARAVRQTLGRVRT